MDGEQFAHLCDDFGVGLQFQETLGEPGGVGLVVGLGEHADSTPQRYLHVGRLQFALSEVRRQLEVSADIIRFFFCNPPPFELNRHPEQVFAARCNQFAPLEVNTN